MSLSGRDLYDAEIQAGVDTDRERTKAEKEAQANCRAALEKLSEFGDVMVSESTMPEDIGKVLGYRYFVQSKVGYTYYHIATHKVKESYVSGYSGSIDSHGNISVSPNYGSTSYYVGDSTPESRTELTDVTSDRFKVVTKGMRGQVLQWENEFRENGTLFLDARDPAKKVVSRGKAVFTWLMDCLFRLGYVVAGLIFLITAPGMQTEMFSSSPLADTYLWERLFGEIQAENYVAYSLLGVLALLGTAILITGKQVRNFYIGDKKRQYGLPLLMAALQVLGILLCIAPRYFSEYWSSFVYYLIIPANVVRLALLFICVCDFVFVIKDIAERKCLRDMKKRTVYRNERFRRDVEILQMISAVEVKDLPKSNYRDTEIVCEL